MPNIVTTRLSYFTAEQFKESISEQANSKLYMFIARPQPWEVANKPPTPVNVEGLQYECWDTMIGLKRISASDSQFVVRRVNWRKFSVYTPYDDRDPLIYTKPFYVLTKDYRVYKCIDNYGGLQSLFEPTSTSLEIFTMQDGYKWKYLYTINPANQIRFLTRNWMPVVTDDEVKDNAVDGTIERVAATIKGSGYTYANTILTVVGDGANATVLPEIVNNKIEGYIVSDKGTNYRYANLVISTSDVITSKAEARIIISPKGGHGYDPVSELGAQYVMLNARFEYDDGAGDIPVNTDFRVLGVIKDPLLYNGSIAENVTLNTNYTLSITTLSGTFVNDEFINGVTSLANGYIVVSRVASGTTPATIRYIQAHNFTSNYISFKVGETITGSVSGATARIDNIYLPEVKHDTGDVLYIENLTPITRSVDQTEGVHLVIKF